MAQHTKEALRALFRKIPEGLQLAIFSPETSEKYDEIKERFGLSDAQRNAMSDQTGLLMLGVLSPNQYVKALGDTMGLPRPTASLIAQDINRDILNPVKDALKIVHNIGAETPTQPISTTPTPPTIRTESILSKNTPSDVPVVAPINKGGEEARSAPVSPAANIFEQKLGNTFRIKSDTQEYKAPEKTPIVPMTPPPPPAPPASATTPQPTFGRPDPYRENI